MECFMKKIWQGKGEEAHSYFVRFGKGTFENRAVLNLQKTTKIKLRGSFEWANDFVKIVSEITEPKFSGVILTKEELLELQEFSSRKKAGLVEYEVSIDSQKIKEIRDRVYALLLDAESSDLSLKMKKKLPKHGKSGEAKTDDKFCVLEADLKYWPQLKEAFMLPECKKCKISHTYVIEEIVFPQREKEYVIEEIVFPQREKDFAKIREMAKRKGKIIRKMEVGGQETKEEKEFEA